MIAARQPVGPADLRADSAALAVHPGLPLDAGTIASRAGVADLRHTEDRPRDCASASRR
jgi:hypothetical protein